MAKVPNNPTPRAEGTCADLEYQCSASNDNYSLIGCLFKAVGDTPAEVRKLKMYRADTDYVAFSGLLAGYIRNATFIYNLGSLSTGRFLSSIVLFNTFSTEIITSSEISFLISFKVSAFSALIFLKPFFS